MRASREQFAENRQRILEVAGRRSTVTKGLRAQLGILERAAKGRSKAARRKQAITALSGMVGAMVVARLVNDSALSNEILTVAASAFGGNKNDNQKRTAV